MAVMYLASPESSIPCWITRGNCKPVNTRVSLSFCPPRMTLRDKKPDRVWAGLGGRARSKENPLSYLTGLLTRAVIQETLNSKCTFKRKVSMLSCVPGFALNWKRKIRY